MRKNKLISFITILIYLLFFVLIFNNSLSYLDPDFGWHLKVGEEIYFNRAVPQINHYNYVFEGQDNVWVDHEWLSNLLIYLVYDNYGYLAVAALFSLLLLFILILLNRFVIKNISKNQSAIFFLILLEFIGLKAIFPHAGVRVQEIGWLLFLLLLLILYFFEKRSQNKKRNSWTTLLLLLPLSYVWANLHGSFLLAPAILFLYLGVKVVEKIIFSYPNKLTIPLINFFNFDSVLNVKDLIILACCSLLSAVTIFFTPYGLKLFDFLLVYGHNTAYLNIISEWLPQFSYPYMYWQLLYLALIIAIWSLILFTRNKKPEYRDMLKPINVVLTLLFIVLSFKSKRHFPLLFIVSLPTLANFLYLEFKNAITNTKFKNKAIRVLLQIFLLLCVLTTISSIVLKTNYKFDPWSSSCNRYPCQALEFLRQNSNYQDLKIFNNYNWGGYLIYTYPEKKLFIDGRLPQKALNQHSYIEEYGLFFKTDILEQKIEEYDIQLFLLDKPKQTKLRWLDKVLFQLKDSDLKSGNNLINFLKESKNWEKVYEDEIAVIFVKK